MWHTQELGATGNKGLHPQYINPALADAVAGLATSATAQATVEVPALHALHRHRTTLAILACTCCASPQSMLLTLAMDGMPLQRFLLWQMEDETVKLLQSPQLQ